MDNTNSLRRGLESLPQELYDMIFNDIFTAPPLAYQSVNGEGPKVPQLMHINRATRVRYAASYYSNSIFVVDAELGRSWVQTWLFAVPGDFHPMIREIRVVKQLSVAAERGHERFQDSLAAVLMNALRVFGMKTRLKAITRDKLGEEIGDATIMGEWEV